MRTTCIRRRYARPPTFSRVANRDGGVVFARIAAIDIRDDEVVIVNDGVPAGDPRSTLAFAPTDELHFIR